MMNNNSKKEILIISVVYFISQFFLLIATGYWWDDWLHITQNWNLVYEQCLAESLPLDAYYIKFLWMLPNGAYRLLVFANYYVGALLIYFILGRIEAFSETDRFWVSLLYVVMPINDARITWVCYSYSVGLLVFWLAFFFSTVWIRLSGWKRILGRVLIWGLLFIAYNTESIMMMTLLVILYLVYEDIKRDWDKNDTKILLIAKALAKNADLFILPIAFYFGKHILFPGATEGIYAGHNYVDWSSLPILLLKSPIYVFVCFVAEFGYNFVLLVLKKNIVIIGLMVVSVVCIIFFCLFYGKKESDSTDLYKSESKKVDTLFLILSLFTYYVGLFPYYLRNHGYVSTREYNGRHSLLLGIGSAMMLYYLVKLIFRQRQKIIGVMIYLAAVVFGILFFNVYYLEWQADYYQSLRFEQVILNNEEILNNDCFFCIFTCNGINIENYRLAGNAYEATGKYKIGKNFYGIPVGGDGRLFELGTEVLQEEDIDGIIIINNTPLDYTIIIKQKLNELFDRNAFTNWLEDSSDGIFIPLTNDEALELKGKLEGNVISIDDLIKEYYEGK